MSLAAQGGHRGVVALLLEAGALPDALSLFNAAEQGHGAVVELILTKAGGDNPAELMACLTKGQTPLLAALRGNHPVVAQVLLKHGPPPGGLPDYEGALLP